MTNINTTYPTARKQHRCDYCTLAIPPGEQYVNETMADDSGIWAWKSHRSCRRLRVELDMIEITDYCIDSEIFQEIVKDYFKENIGQAYLVAYEDILQAVKEAVLKDH